MSLLTSLKESLLAIPTSSDIFELGIVDSYADGVINISGFTKLVYMEVVEVQVSASVSVPALVLEIKTDTAKALLLDQIPVKAGLSVKSYNNLLKLKVDPELRGVVYDAFGRVVYGQNSNSEEMIQILIEDNAPELIDREPVSRPLSTGILAIDSMVNIGKGQRQLIIGDRQTGKTSIALDAIINQKNQNTICIYCSIGQKQSSITNLVNQLKISGALDYTVIFNASANESVAMQYLAPFSAVTLGQYLMNQGKDVLVIYDDLSKHAVAWRQLSLLLKRPVGREAFPGDVFYLHSRLLERGGQLVESLGGGSLTALPIIETLANDVTGYIPTNVISITDGQIYLESNLFNKGIRPAISVGLSVSRVGGAAQSKAIKKNSSKIKLELSQYRELASFSQIGSGLDAGTKATLHNGQVLTGLLIQDNLKPLSSASQIARLKLASLGLLNNIDIKNLPNLIEQLDNESLLNFGNLKTQLDLGLWSDEIDQELTTKLKHFMESVKI